MSTKQLSFPDGWQMSGSWKRAVSETKLVDPINDGEFIVKVGSGDYHRVEFIINGDSLCSDCSCVGYGYRRWCAHVAALWWQFVRGRIIVNSLDSDRVYRFPPDSIEVRG